MPSSLGVQKGLGNSADPQDLDALKQVEEEIIAIEIPDRFVANLCQNVRFLPTDADTGAAAFVFNWTLVDGVRSRRHTMAIEERAAVQISQRDDLASQTKLQVRSAWLASQEAQQRIPVAGAAIIQAEENLRVARGRYQEQRGTNTEVLDAERLRDSELRQLL